MLELDHDRVLPHFDHPLPSLRSKILQWLSDTAGAKAARRLVRTTRMSFTTSQVLFGYHIQVTLTVGHQSSEGRALFSATVLRFNPVDPLKHAFR
jgi:hypothetical protein